MDKNWYEMYKEQIIKMNTALRGENNKVCSTTEFSRAPTYYGSSKNLSKII